MGLDTSHDCFHAAYSTFMAWRVWLHGRITGKIETQRTLENAWAHGTYGDTSVPINMLMSHSDCDGEIAAETCGPLADALERLLPTKPFPIDVANAYMVEITEQFIAGLRRAAALGESVDFL